MAPPRPLASPPRGARPAPALGPPLPCRTADALVSPSLPRFSRSQGEKQKINPCSTYDFSGTGRTRSAPREAGGREKSCKKPGISCSGETLGFGSPSAESAAGVGWGHRGHGGHGGHGGCRGHAHFRGTRGRMAMPLHAPARPPASVLTQTPLGESGQPPAQFLLWAQSPRVPVHPKSQHSSPPPWVSPQGRGPGPQTPLEFLVFWGCLPLRPGPPAAELPKEGRPRTGQGARCCASVSPSGCLGVREQP